MMRFVKTHQEIRFSAIDIVRKLNLKKGMNVADMGSGGHGGFVYRIAKAVGDDGCVFAVDVQKNLLKMLVDRAKIYGISNIYPVHAYIENVVFIDNNEVDVVLFIDVLHQIENKSAAIYEGFRMLKHGGRMIIIDWHPKKGCPHSSIQDLCFYPEELYDKFDGLEVAHIDKFSVEPYYWGLDIIKM